jgi:hypothetical protein
MRFVVENVLSILEVNKLIQGDNFEEVCEKNFEKI